MLVLSFSLIPAVTAAAATINVPGDYSTIQAAINAANPGDTINVAAGTYNENVNVNKSLTLQGAGSAIVTVTAAINTTSVFTVNASNVSISGFTASGGPAGIYLNSNVAFCNISNNILTGNSNGIFLYGGSNHNTFTKNTASNNTSVGFFLFYSDHNTFGSSDPADANIASSNGLVGFNLQASPYNTFTGNEANANPRYGFCLGGEEGGSDYNTLTGNTADLNNYGIYIIGGSNNTLTGNTFNLNVVEGFRLRRAFSAKGAVDPTNLPSITNLTVQNNTITNSPIGIDIYSSIPDVTSWTVTHNNIVGNTVYGVSNNSTSILNAANNWWGANSGPTHASNPLGTGDAVSDYVDYDPWLVIGVSADPVSIKADGTSTSTITADMTKNSDGVDTSIQGHIPDGTQITFSTDKGSIGSLTVDKTTTNGVATATLTSSTTGETATVTASAPPHTPAATATATVNFVEIPPVTYTITASAGDGGAIDPVGNVVVNYGANQSFTITPDTGYHVATLTVDGSPITPAESYTFTDVTANHTISATFTQITHALTMAKVGNGTVTPGTGTYPEGDMEITATAEDGWQFSGWSAADMAEIAAPSLATTTLTLDKDKTVVAFFTKSGVTVEDSKTETTSPGDDTVDAKTEADTVVDKSGPGTPTVTVANYSGNPGTGFSGDTGKYIDVHIDDATGVTEIEIRVYYTAAEIDGLVETSLSLRWWDGTNWVLCSDSGVNTTDIPGPPAYSGYMWARIRSDTTPTLAQLTGSVFGGGGALVPSPVWGGDTTPPRISSVSNYHDGVTSIAVTSTTADIYWTTDEESTSQVKYWASPSLLSPLDKTLVTQHHVQLTGLTPNTTYYYQAMSRDAAGNRAASDVCTFTTLAEASAATFTSSDLSISPVEVSSGEMVTISVVVTNSGNVAGGYELTLEINDVVEATRELTLEAGASESISFTVSREEAGSYSVLIDGLSGSFTVTEPASSQPAPEDEAPEGEVAEVENPVNWPVLGGVIAAVVIIGLFIFVVRRKAA